MDIDAMLIIGLAVFVAFYVQTAIGFAAALISMPIMLMVTTLPNAVAIIAPLFLVWSVAILFTNKTEVNWEVIKGIAIGTFVGLIIGVVVLLWVQPLILKKILGIFVLIFVAYSFWKQRRLTFLHRWKFSVGVLGGFFSGLFSAGAPIFVPYVYSIIENKNSMRATNIGISSCINIVRFSLLLALGGVTPESFQVSLWVFPVFVLAMIIGQKTHQYINEKIFKQIILWLLLASGISLVFL